MAILDRVEANEETVMTAAMGQRSAELSDGRRVMNWLKRRIRPSRSES